MPSRVSWGRCRYGLKRLGSWLQFEIEVASTVNGAYSQPTVIRPFITGDHATVMLAPELQEFARAIGEERTPTVTAADGRRVLQVLDAVVAADRRARPSRSSDGSGRGRAERGWLLPMLAQGFLDALGARGSDALIDTKCLAQAVQALARVPILQVAVGDAFEGACFLKGDADVAGEDERLIVMVAGLAGGRGPR